MTQRNPQPELRSASRTALAVLIGVLAMALAAQAQSFQVLHNFTGGADGTDPYGGLTIDRTGRLYGTTIGPDRCYVGCGTVYSFTRHGSGWLLTPLYAFQNPNEGNFPTAPVTIAADGSLYGTTTQGGGSGNCSNGCGTVYRLQPPAEICRSVSCPWTETILYAFQGGEGLAFPGGVVFDHAGNIFGAAASGPFTGGELGGGLYELTQTQGHWSYQTLYEFPGSPYGCTPEGFVLLDQADNIYGTTYQCGAYGNGTVYEISPSGSGWSPSFNYSFAQPPDGIEPVTGLTSDAAGNLYGTTLYGGANGFGEVFELSPANGSYTYSVLYDSFSGGAGPASSLVMDAAGNLYGAQIFGGANNQGMIFKLTPGNNGWTITDLHDFSGEDGKNPSGSMVFDSNGNFYGTTENGGMYGDGVLWEITP